MLGFALTKMIWRMLPTWWILLIWILHHSEAIDITCGTVRPKEGESVACTCSTNSGNDIDWQKDGSFISKCLSTGSCFPEPALYEFSYDVAGSTKEYNITIKAFSYSDCANFSCTDGTPAQETLRVAAFDESQTFTSSEPQNKNGNITVTSSCLYMASDVTVSWYKVVNGKEILYTDETPLKSSDSAACSDQCAGVSAETVMSTLYHEEVTSKFEMGKLRVKFKHSYYAQPRIWTSSVEYQLRKGPCWCWCWWGCCDDIGMCILCWLVFILIICIILYIIGIIIGIILTNTNCCCKCFYHCKDSDCCECCHCCGENNYVRCKCCASWPCGVLCNINQLPFWYHILWATIIGIPVALGIYMIWRCCGRGNGDVKPKEEKPRHETRSGNTGTGQKKPETKKNESKDSGAHIENEQHNQGKKPREQPLPPSGAGAATGTMHGREDSDGAVSREHVDLQESGRTLKQRPMPDIPRKNERQGHDSKGRGLSANFNDDDHPLIGVNIPTQKAGALEALPEGTGGDGSVKKLKKKKKKSKDQEDEV